MNTVIIFGSPRRNGLTRRLADMYIEKFCTDGAVTEFDAYQMNVSPCVACGSCKGGNSCVFDDMQPLIEAIKNADRVVLASPVYFLSLPAPLKAIIDRMQVLHEAEEAGDNPMRGKKREAVVLLTAGAPSEKGATVMAQLKWVLPLLCVQSTKIAVVPGTDRLSESGFLAIAEQKLSDL